MRSRALRRGDGGRLRGQVPVPEAADGDVFQLVAAGRVGQPQRLQGLGLDVEALLAPVRNARAARRRIRAQRCC